MTKIEKIYPTIEELTKIQTFLRCPEKGCLSTFKSGANLTLHLAKTHKKNHLMQTGLIKFYYCPVTNCQYNKLNPFDKFKQIKQHYLKVHSMKIYNCHFCEKTFATESFRDKHIEYCNVTFKCCDCKANYPSYETLKTHARRKKHTVLEKKAYKTTNEQASQTEKSSHHKSIKKNTQETQTVTEYVRKHRPEMPKNSIEIQTMAITSRTTSCNTSFIFEDPIIETSSSSTQTPITTDLLLCTDSPMTPEKDELAIDNNNSETQTDLILFQDDLLDYYTNMCTQTYDDWLLNDINHIETQTGFDEMLKSVQSQTVHSHSNLDMNNMETQTECESQFGIIVA